MSTYRSPWMNEELEALRTTARRFFETEVAPHYDRWVEQGKIDREVWRKAGELGLLCIGIPEEYGGHGGTFAHEVVVMEEQARVADTALPYVPGSAGGPYMLMKNGTPEQTRKWMPKLVSGEHFIAVCVTEPGGGSDVANVRTTARRDGNEYVINGSKTFVTMGSQADLAIVCARTGGPGKDGLSMFMVEVRDCPGFHLGRRLKKVGQHAIDTHEVFLEDLRVPVENLLGGVEGKAFGGAMSGFDRERLVIALTSIATAERAIELTVDYAKERKMFGQTLWGFQNTRIKLAECMTEAKIGRVFIDTLIMKVLNGEPVDSADSAMAKWWCSEKQNRIIDECLQFFGGYGYMMEYPIARLFVDARVQKIYGGANEALKGIIAKAY
ncbi:acyl-CoA dehydrogenase family protein [Aromatoleum aromaticum]|uniref:Acyl-CoA dehydrogenase n=1 Tax=Aromatoleum aromaticum (strain DSM 19018 / LMG 30748 / EbN1) TaxID=76114 RepID=Q5P031_AROAE|nr:acyl-CoA dehydrogenase family protein [Aromatoleum aromaticum]CAI09333.1 Acyl-CoA dehydrogenase [Aromatoleum aromaticum EbN1]